MESQLPDDPKGSALLEDGNRRLAGKLGSLKCAFDNPWKASFDKVYSYIDDYVKRAVEEIDLEEKQEDPFKKEK
jgi:hypothetical protein